jgi:hypothetical protein
MMGRIFWTDWAIAEFFSQLTGDCRSWCDGLTEEAHESLDVLCRRCQEELLPNELQSPQAQATQPDLVLEFSKQGFHLLSLPLCLGKLRCIR